MADIRRNDDHSSDRHLHNLTYETLGSKDSGIDGFEHPVEVVETSGVEETESPTFTPTNGVLTMRHIHQKMGHDGEGGKVTLTPLQEQGMRFINRVFTSILVILTLASILHVMREPPMPPLSGKDAKEQISNYKAVMEVHQASTDAFLTTLVTKPLLPLLLATLAAVFAPVIARSKQDKPPSSRRLPMDAIENPPP